MTLMEFIRDLMQIKREPEKKPKATGSVKRKRRVHGDPSSASLLRK
jgi:hypothetical protein